MKALPGDVIVEILRRQTGIITIAPEKNGDAIQCVVHDAGDMDFANMVHKAPIKKGDIVLCQFYDSERFEYEGKIYMSGSYSMIKAIIREA